MQKKKSSYISRWEPGIVCMVVVNFLVLILGVINKYNCDPTGLLGYVALTTLTNTDTTSFWHVCSTYIPTE